MRKKAQMFFSFTSSCQLFVMRMGKNEIKNVIRMYIEMRIQCLCSPMQLTRLTKTESRFQSLIFIQAVAYHP